MPAFQPLASVSSMEPESRSLERLVPEEVRCGDVTGSETLELHLARYEFAAVHASPGRLLDIACGTGYGTRAVADRLPGSTAVGVDIAPDAIGYAQRKYGRPGVEFHVADALQFNDSSGFDTVISLETIEHVPDPERLIRNLVGLLRPGGVLVGSVPTTPSVDANPHHLHDFTETSFRRMFSPHRLTEIACFRQTQPFALMPLLRRTEERARDLRPNLARYYVAHPPALVRRLVSTVVHGFTNRYLTVAWRKPGSGI